MKVGKSGMILPMILVFIMISQLVYWGLLRLNSINLQRYELYNNYYQSRIQEQMSNLWYLDLVNNLSHDFEDFIYDRFIELYNSRSPKPSMSDFSQDPHIGIQYMGMMDNYEQLYLFSHSLYLSEQGFQYSDSFNKVTVNGSLTEDNYPLTLDEVYLNLINQRNLDLELEEMIHTITLQGYRYIKEDSQRRLHTWRINLKTDLSLEFNNGRTHISIEGLEKNISSYVYPRDFLRKTSFELADINFIQHWQGFYFEKEIEE